MSLGIARSLSFLYLSQDEDRGEERRKRRPRRHERPGGGEGTRWWGQVEGASPCLTPHHGGARMSDEGKSRAHYSTAVSAVGLLAFGLSAAALGLPLWGYFNTSDGESHPPSFLLVSCILGYSPTIIFYILSLRFYDPQRLFFKI